MFDSNEFRNMTNRAFESFQGEMEKSAAYQMMPYPGVSDNKAGINNTVYGQTETPSQFFTIAGQFLPRDLHGIVRWAYYLLSVEPLVSEVIRKLSSFPITDFVIDTPDLSLKSKYEKLIYNLDLKAKLISIGFDYYLVGNVFIGIYFPFKRMLICPSCSSSYSVSDHFSMTKFVNYQFNCQCPKCNYTGVMKHSDQKSKDSSEVNLVVFDPRDISVNYNPISGKSEYWYEVPSALRSKITDGDLFTVAALPWSIIEAVRDSKQYLFYKDSIYHLKMPGVTNALPGLGVPPLIGMWETVFNKAAARRANSAIATEMFMPLRIIYPDTSNFAGTGDPSTRFSLQAFAKNMRQYLARHKTDPLAAVMSPIPVGYQEITGGGKQLFITQEIEQMEDYLLMCLGVSKEMLSGTLSWTASTVGLRLFENTLYRYTDQMQRLVDWLFKKIGPEFDLEHAPVTFEPFKFTDNDGVINTMMELASNSIISQETALAAIGLDYDKEQGKLREEQIELAKQQVITDYKKSVAAWSQTRQQSAAGESNYKTALEQAGEVANQFLTLEEGPRRSALMRLKVQDPAQYMLVSKLIEEYRSNPDYKEQVAEDGAAAAQQATQESPNEEQGGNTPEAQTPDSSQQQGT